MPPAQAIHAVADLAVEAQQAGNLPLAERLYGQVLLENPHHAASLHNLGAIRLLRDDSTAAIELIQAALRTDPLRPMFHCTLGSALRAAGDLLRSEQAFRRALQLKPDYPAAWEGLGAALRGLDRFEEAATALQRALQIEPASRPAALNLGNVLLDLGRATEAEQIYHDMLDRNPLDTDCTVPYAVLKLSRGDPAGWSGYAMGHWSPEWLKLDPPVMVPLPQWDGESLSNKGLLLYGEQGIGDEIMFASLATGAAQQSARTALLCEPRLVPLFARSFPGIRVGPLPPRTQPPLLHADIACDVRCSLSRLPGLTGLTARADGGAPYLLAGCAIVDKWRARLAALGPGLKVGISWRGGAIARTRSMRSIDLASLQPLFDIPGVHFVDVQYGSHGEEIAAFNAGRSRPMHRFEEVDPMRDMDGFASLLSALDLVVSVDNSTVHLAGALGVRTWMLCPFNPSWRWARSGDTTHWYRSLRLFRQARPEHAAWQPVIDTIATALQSLCAAGSCATSAFPAHGEQSTEALPAPGVPVARASVLLLNDTSCWYDWGCTGTSLALHEGLRAAGHVVDSVAPSILGRIGPLPAGGADLDDEDLSLRFCERNAPLVQRIQSVREVIINGEAGLQGGASTARALLYLAWLAKHRFGKRTCIVNHSLPAPGAKADATADLRRRVYRAMDFIAVRDEHSAQQLRALGVDATPAFDCLPLYIAAHAAQQPVRRARRLLLAGSPSQQAPLVDLQVTLAEQALSAGHAVDVLVGANAYLAVDDVQWMAALHPRLRGRYTLVAATSERQWLDAIAGASLLVSGRWHQCIAAACLGTPFLMTSANPARIDPLVERLGLKRETVWISADDPGAARSRMMSLLENPAPALVPEAQLAVLRDLARRNFAGLSNPA